MATFRTSALRMWHLLVLTSTWLSLTEALDIDICSSLNTASTAKNVSIYQTNGLCHDFCIQDYAFAITQGNGCWCSDYFPDEASTVNVTKCNIPCPAYPLEDCGGTGLYGYIQLNQVAPSGTTTASGPTGTSSQVRFTTVTTRVTTTVQNPASRSTSETSTASSSSSSTSGASSASSIVQTFTDGGGAVTTVTVAPSHSPANTNDGSGGSASSSRISSGAIVGIVIGVLVILAAAAGAAVWYMRRRKQNEDDYQDDPSGRGSSSRMINPEMNMTGAPATAGSVGNRNSTIQIDPRMDPFKQGLYVRSGSHESLNTLNDGQDYSRRIQQPRVLRATNPDPENN